MDRKRVMNEILALQEKFPVEYKLDEGVVQVKQVRYPDGWTPQNGHILYELSEVYPRSPPWVYIPEQLSYDGRSSHKLRSDKSGYSKWCIDSLDWNPERHTLVTMTKLLLASMERPNADNPYHQA